MLASCSFFCWFQVTMFSVVLSWYTFCCSFCQLLPCLGHLAQYTRVWQSGMFLADLLTHLVLEEQVGARGAWAHPDREDASPCASVTCSTSWLPSHSHPPFLPQPPSLPQLC